METHLDNLHQARMQAVETKTLLRSMEMTKATRATAEILHKANKKQDILLEAAVDDMANKKVEKHFQRAQKQA